MPKKETKTIGPFLAESTALPPMETIDHLESAGKLTRGLSSRGGQMLGEITRLRDILPKMLKTTKLSWTNEQGQPVSVSLNSVATFDAAFDNRMQYCIPVIAMMLEVSFFPFFDGVGELENDPAPAADGSSSTSSPSTSATGSATDQSSPAI